MSESTHPPDDSDVPAPGLRAEPAAEAAPELTAASALEPAAGPPLEPALLPADAEADADADADADRPAGTTTAPEAPFADAQVADADLAGADLAGADLAEVDVIESPPRSRRPRAAVLTAVAVVLVVLLGGGAFAAVRMWNGPTGTLPEDLVPGSVAAFARIDLSPGIGQRVKVESLLRKAGGSGPRSLEDTKRDAFTGLDVPIGYDDVASWFDDRAGVALWADPDRTDAAGRAVLLVVLSSRDDERARKALTAAQRRTGTDSIGFVAGDGHVLLAFGGKDLQRVATAAVAAAAKAPLSKEPAFTSAVAKLPADQPGLAWADLARATVLREAFVATALDGEKLDPQQRDELAAGPLALPGVKGTLVLGVQAADNGIEVRARISGAAGLPLTGAAAAVAGTDVTALLGALPGDATAAGVAGGPLGDLSVLGEPGSLLSSTLFPLQFFGDLGAANIPDLPAGAELLDPDHLPPGADHAITLPPGADHAIMLPPGVDPHDPAAVDKYLQEHPELFQNGSGVMLLPPGANLVRPEDLQKGTAALAKAVAAATSVSVVVAGPTGTGEGPGGPLQIDLRLADVSAARQLQTDLSALLKTSKTTCEVREDHVILRTKTYAAGGAGTLADNARFRTATAGGVPGATAAFYLDGERSDSAPAKAIGVTVGHDGADTVMLARILIG